MLDRQKGKHVFECDSCADSLETGTGDFQEARQMLQDADWRSRKIGDVWSHYCPDCRDDRALRR